MDQMRDPPSDSGAGVDSPKRFPGDAAAKQVRAKQAQIVGIEDVATRAMITRLDRFKWKVDVKVERARRLRAADTSWMGMPTSSDPYVKIQLGNQLRETKPVQENLNPVWNQCYELDLGHGHAASLNDKVRLTV